MKFAFPKLSFTSRLTSREKKVLSSGLAVAILFCGLYFLVFPMFDKVKQYPDQIVQKTNLLKKYKEVIAERKTQEQSLDSTQKRMAEYEGHLLSARTTAAAQAELQGFVNDLVKQSQLQVNRSDFLPVKELSKDYQKVSVRLDAVGTINQITAYLVGAKAMPLFVMNDELRIWNYGGMNEDWKKTKQMAATLVISGVMRHE